MVIAGIDPGINGAAVIIDKSADNITLLGCHDFPLISTRLSSGKEQQRIDGGALHQILSTYTLDLVVLELVNAMPGQGVTSMFSFGHAAGVVEAVARINAAEVQLVRPSVWKPAYGLSRAKGEARNLAITLTGDTTTFKRVKDDGRAEAYLLARYGALDGQVERINTSNNNNTNGWRQDAASSRSDADILAGLMNKVRNIT